MPRSYLSNAKRRRVWLRLFFAQLALTAYLLMHAGTGCAPECPGRCSVPCGCGCCATPCAPPQCSDTFDCKAFNNGYCKDDRCEACKKDTDCGNGYTCQTGKCLKAAATEPTPSSDASTSE